MATNVGGAVSVAAGAREGVRVGIGWQRASMALAIQLQL